MTNPKRLSVKFLVAPPHNIDLAALVPVFQRWIQQQTVEGMLIDVVDYKHVPNGPGIILISHEGDYALDTFHGRPGLQYTYKQIAEDNPVEAILTAVRRALQAVHALNEEKTVNFTVAVNELQVTLLDRLTYPNTPEGFEQAQAVVGQVAAQLFEGGEITQLPRDSREPLALHAAAPETVTLADLSQRASASQTPITS